MRTRQFRVRNVHTGELGTVVRTGRDAGAEFWRVAYDNRPGMTYAGSPADFEPVSDGLKGQAVGRGEVVTSRTIAERWLARQARLAGKDEDEAIASYRLRKEAEAFDRHTEQARVAALPPVKPVRLHNLGVSLEHGSVYTLGTVRRRLGDLTGATAQMGSTSSTKHTLGAAAGAAVNPVTLPLAPFLALRKQGSAGAIIVFANGDTHPVTVKGNQQAMTGLEADVLRFNAVARQAAS
jgi:hypothetical protein